MFLANIRRIRPLNTWLQHRLIAYLLSSLVQNQMCLVAYQHPPHMQMRPPPPPPVLPQGEDGSAISGAEYSQLVSPSLGNTSLPARRQLVERWDQAIRNGTGLRIGVLQV